MQNNLDCEAQSSASIIDRSTKKRLLVVLALENKTFNTNEYETKSFQRNLIRVVIAKLSSGGMQYEVERAMAGDVADEGQLHL